MNVKSRQARERQKQAVQLNALEHPAGVYEYMTETTNHQQNPSYAEHKSRIQTRLRRLEGQVRGVQRMIDEDTYCVDVLTQLSAIIAAARGVGMLVLEDHIRGCVVCAPENEREERLDELTQAIERFTRTVGG
jgi:DNA-binding FrmR family transcriptional regulator